MIKTHESKTIHVLNSGALIGETNPGTGLELGCKVYDKQAGKSEFCA